ncbi:autophagy-related 18a [Anaeramoeba flamelloides]|uniref:Autophagy-related 18a n=1 Tax=Anaeramoeba flamelloides TaxID=1746091 RepID=A0AAV7Z0H2_9EUKA|nr:autophagy-related 18a isoform e [Anaeramoeba flamelloides]KAJ6241561.1 autophagy-related 18a [Anaeramoeba flamelloides]
MNLREDNNSKFFESEILFFKICEGEYATFGLREGVKIYRINPLESIWNGRIGEIRLVEFLSIKKILIAFVGTGKEPTLSPRKIILYNPKIPTKTELSFDNTILSMEHNKTRFIVNCFEKIHIYEIPDFELIGTIPKGVQGNPILALSETNSNYLAFPKEKTVEIYDLNQFEKLYSIKCHKNPISYLTFSLENNYLATCSKIGTLVRIFDLDNKPQKVWKEYRRGTRNAKIYNISFLVNDEFMLITSNHETIHVVNLKNGKSFGKLNLEAKIPRICGFDQTNKNQFFLISPEPKLLIYQIDTENKKLVFVKACKIDSNQEEQN